MDHIWKATFYGGFAGLTTLVGVYLVLMMRSSTFTGWKRKRKP